MENNISTIDNKSSLAWVDWIIIAAMSIVSIGIGIYYRFTGTRGITAQEYFHANRSIKVVILSFTLMIAYISPILILASVGENYSIGVMFNALYFGMILATPIVIYFYLPVFYELQIMSIYEYLDRRFGIITRLIASITSFPMEIFYTGIIIYSTAIILQIFINLDNTLCIFYIGFICTFYTSIGGIKAVIATNIFQGALILICVCSVITVALTNLQGGILNAFDVAKKGERFVFNFNFDPTIQYTWWSLTFGGMFYFLSLIGCDQLGVQRLLTAKSLGDAQNALWVHIPMTLIMIVCFSFSGLILYAHYVHCDPVTAGEINSYDIVISYFAKNHMTRIPAVTGIFIAGILSGCLSTVSTMLNSLATVALEDYVKPLCRQLGQELPEDKVVFYGRLLTILIGFISLSVAILAPKFGNIIQMIIIINGVVGGPILGIFTLGILNESANEISAVSGMIIAIVGNLLWIFSIEPTSSVLSMSIDGCPNVTYHHQNSTNTDNQSSLFFINRFSYLWIGVLGFNTAMTIATIVDFFVKKYYKTPPIVLDANLFTPILARRIKRRRENESRSQVNIALDTNNFNH